PGDAAEGDGQHQGQAVDRDCAAEARQRCDRAADGDHPRRAPARDERAYGDRGEAEGRLPGSEGDPCRRRRQREVAHQGGNHRGQGGGDEAGAGAHPGEAGEDRPAPARRAGRLAGAGRAFSAGGDFNWMRGVTKDALYEMRREGKQIVWNLLDVELPIVAAVNGPAIGLGATIALLCDVVYMADTAILADPHVRVGIVAGDGGAAIWPLVLGPALAKRYLMQGDSLSAAE